MSGFSLISVLIGVVLSLLLMGATVEWYPILKQALIKAKKKSHHLEIGRSVFQYMMQDLKFSGYQGCRTMDSHYPLRKHYIKELSPYRFIHWDRNVYGFNHNPTLCAQKAPERICKLAVNNKDILIIYQVPYQFSLLAETLTSSEQPLKLLSEGKVREGGIVLVSDPFQGDVFVANKVDDNNTIYHDKTANENQTQTLSKSYQKDTEVVELQTVVYYLGVSDRQDPNTKVYSLYRGEFFHRAQEIVEGIIDIQFEYKTLNAQGEFLYKKAENIPENAWPCVLGVRIKATTEENKIWEYEFATRNRHCTHVNVRVIDDPLVTFRPPFKKWDLNA